MKNAYYDSIQGYASTTASTTFEDELYESAYKTAYVDGTKPKTVVVSYDGQPREMSTANSFYRSGFSAGKKDRLQGKDPMYVDKIEIDSEEAIIEKAKSDFAAIGVQVTVLKKSEYCYTTFKFFNGNSKLFTATLSEISRKVALEIKSIQFHREDLALHKQQYGY